MPASNEVEDQIVASIRRIIRAIDLQSRRLLDQYKLTGPQLATLREAQKLGEISISTLARAVHLSQPTVSGILNRLERRGLVVRKRSAGDRRSVVMGVTEEGMHVRLPGADATSLLAALVVAIFFITSSGSGSFVVDMLTSGGDPDPPGWRR
jgi:DNA-binding transcriptional ArsR family regulator